MEQSFELNNAVSTGSLMQSRLDLLKTNVPEANSKLDDAQRRKAAEAARGFESMFINMMMKEMKEALLDGAEESGNTFGADTLGSYADMLFADEIAKNGRGLGIAEKVYEQITGEKLDPIRIITRQAEKKVAPDYPSETKSYNAETKSYDAETKSYDLSQYKAKNVAQQIKENFGGSFRERVENRLSNFDSIISQAAGKYKVPEELIKAIITTESAGRSDAKSHVGAKGLMQLMDGTAKDLGVKNSFDPYQNIMGGTKYIKMMLDRFDGDLNLALAAYNAGPGNVQKYGGIPPFKETQHYVKKVQKYFNSFSNDI